MSQKAFVMSDKQKVARFLPVKILASIPNVLTPLVRLLARMNVSPNIITFLSLLAGIAAGIFFAIRQPILALIFIILCGIFDVLDGKVAAEENRKSLYGAIYDSTIDRYAEFSIYLGIAVHFQNHWALWIVFLAVLGAFMVSYTRARAEGLGITCRIGIMQRAERLVTLSLVTLIGTIFHLFDYAMIAGLGLIAIFSNIAALQRIFLVRKIERTNKPGEEVIDHE